ncbi:MAG: hypothetical protein WBP26_04920 [Candidatus Saccharimonadales bacterium]
MAHLSGEGLCDTRCELDDYTEALTEMALAEQIDTEPAELRSNDFALKKKAREVTQEWYGKILTSCLADATTLPCTGLGEGVDLNVGRPIHCPLVVGHLLAGVLE